MSLELDIPQSVHRALAEDLGVGDATAQLIPEHKRCRATVISRQTAVLCGQAWFDEVFRQLDSEVHILWKVSDGDLLAPGQVICEISGLARPILSGERSALNFLQTLSATATRAHKYVTAVAGTQVHILDTRKTLPGLRLAQKYAARCGGCENHRMGLYDGILIKENHILAAGSISAVVTQALEHADGRMVEIEVESLQQPDEALAAGAPRILLDNMDIEMLRQAVAINSGRARLEASGGVNLETVRAIAETGVDFISVGELTKDIQAIDLSMRVQLEK